MSLAALAGCGDDDGMVPGDAGSGDRDSGGGVDAGRIDSGGVDSGAGTDAGPGTDGGTDAGPSPTARPIEFEESCPELTPCGGDLVGAWRYDGVCVTHAEVEAELAGSCPSASFISGSGSVDGTVVFDDTTITRDGTTIISIVVNVPATCTMGAGCTLVAAAIEAMAMVDSVTCADAADGCDCTIGDTEIVSDSDPYVVAGNVFENSTSMRRWEYCVDGTDLTVREVTSGSGADPIEPGIQSLAGD